MKLGWRSGGGCLGGDEEEMEVARVLALEKRNEKREMKMQRESIYRILDL